MELNIDNFQPENDETKQSLVLASCIEALLDGFVPAAKMAGMLISINNLCISTSTSKPEFKKRLKYFCTALMEVSENYNSLWEKKDA